MNFLSQFHPVITPPAQDGIFGPGTAQSVREFQRIMGLPQDGIVGPETWRTLYDAYWGARNAGATPPPVTPPPTPPTGTFNHVVQSGDTLWLLAQRFSTTVDIIKQLNNLTSDSLSVGQVLRIPSTTTEPPVTPPTGSFNYTVRSGDTIFWLAQRFGTTVDAIRTLNNLTTTNLTVGQVLKIPGNAFQYTVQPGDTLFTLAQRFGTTVERIRAFNNLPNNNLSVGQVLLIPQ